MIDIKLMDRTMETLCKIVKEEIAKDPFFVGNSKTFVDLFETIGFVLACGKSVGIESKKIQFLVLELLRATEKGFLDSIKINNTGNEN